MKRLMILGLAALLSQSGCSTNRHLLEPGHDKRQEVSPEIPSRRACGVCGSTNPCDCQKNHDSNATPPSGVTP